MAKPWEQNWDQPESLATVKPWEQNWDKELKWEDVPLQAAYHAIPSGIDVIKSTYVDPVLHPIDTAQSVLDLGNAALQKFLPQKVIDVMHKINPETAKNPEKLNQVYNYYRERYKDEKAFKKALAEDPFGVAADLSAFVQPTRLLAKGHVSPSVESALNAASNLDPTSSALQMYNKVSDMNVPSSIVGNLTGTGSDVMRELYKAGQQGGEKQRVALEHMREPEGRFEEVVTDAKDAINNIQRARAAQYEADMAGVNGLTSQIDFGPLNISLQDLYNRYNFRGEPSGEASAKIQKNIQDAVDDWAAKDPSIYHTPAGVDFLKRRIGEIAESQPYGQTPRSIADQAYRLVRKEIENQAPDYATAMKNYADTSDLLHELTGTFSLGPKARTDTSLRKLQQALRNNAYTNYGYRSQLIDELESSGAPHLRTKVAGQAASAWLPRGLQGLASATDLGAAITFKNPYLAFAVPFQSPRLMGEAAIKAGEASNYTRGALKAYQDALDSAGIDQRFANNLMYHLQKNREESELPEEVE